MIILIALTLLILNSLKGNYFHQLILIFSSVLLIKKENYLYLIENSLNINCINKIKIVYHFNTYILFFSEFSQNYKILIINFIIDSQYIK